MVIKSAAQAAYFRRELEIYDALQASLLVPSPSSIAPTPTSASIVEAMENLVVSPPPYQPVQEPGNNFK